MLLSFLNPKIKKKLIWRDRKCKIIVKSGSSGKEGQMQFLCTRMSKMVEEVEVQVLR